ncbi:MAG: hypothetical protein ACOCZE_04255 [Planctomycetota bacterium]
MNRITVPIALAASLLGANLFLSPSAQAESLLVEGFETPANLKTTGPEPVSVRRPTRVTEGNLALQLGQNGSVQLNVLGSDLQKMAWLKLDTFSETDQPHLLELRVRAGGRTTGVRAVVSYERDTLSVPLKWLEQRIRGDWPDEGVQIEVVNLAPGALVIDNARLESLTPVPEEMVLLDFGPENQKVWPGFAAANHATPTISWSGLHRLASESMGYPDPLTEDWSSVYPRPGLSEKFSLLWKGETPAVAWIWLTHYATRSGLQGDSFYLRQGRRLLEGRKLSSRDMLSTRGLMEGYKQPWTGKWFSTEYADHFVELVQVSLKPGANPLELQNAQLAAVAIAPAQQQTLARKYVGLVNEQLQRFRRQFVAGRQEIATSDLQPTEQEQRSGFILLSPRGEAICDPSWQPAETDRVAAIQTVAPLGGKAIVPFAVVSLKPQAMLRGQVPSLRSGSGGILPTLRRSRIHFVEPIPFVQSPVVRNLPWLLSELPRGIEAGQVVPIFLELDIPETISPGKYDGAIKILGSAGITSLNLSVDVVDLGKSDAAPLAVALNTDVRHLLPTLYADQSGTRIRSANEDLLQLLIKEGFASAAMASPRRSMARQDYLKMLAEDGLAKAMSSYRSPVFSKIDAVFHQLARDRVPVNSAIYRKDTSEAADLIQKTLSAMKIEKGYGLTDAWSVYDFQGMVQRGGHIATGGLAPAALTFASRVKDLKDGARDQYFRAFQAMVLQPDCSGIDELMAGFRQSGPEKKTFCFVTGINRYVCGFFPAALKADGIFVRDAVSSRGPYKGFDLNRSVAMAPTPDGKFTPTILTLRMRQGLADLQLVMRCRDLLARAAEQRVQADALEMVLAELESLGKLQPRYGDDENPETISPDRLDQFRYRLLQAGAELAGRLK